MYDDRPPRRLTSPNSWIKPKDGNLYYVRLRTPQGIFYKLGVTSKNSIAERFAPSGNSHLVDKTFIFTYLEDAYPVEASLHKTFKWKKAFPNGRNPDKPLYDTGQSELYADDVLGLDLSLYQRALTHPDGYEDLPHLEKASIEMGVAFELLIELITGLFSLLGRLIDWLMGAQEPTLSEPRRTVFPPTRSKKVTRLIEYITSANSAKILFPRKK